ncbi:MAG: hypothetical protein ACE5OZ_04130 [Candidatus Heimdallarchaeota archaeon]
MTDDNHRDFEGIAKEQLNQEMRRIEAVQAVLKRKGLDFLDQMRTEDDVGSYQSVLGLWQNETFLAELEAAVLAELAPDPGGIRRFLADFEAKIEDLDARWLLTLWWQTSGTREVDLDPLIREYQGIYTKGLLQRLERKQQVSDVDPVTRQRLNIWQQVAERELVDSALVSQRTRLRQEIANYRFPHQGRDYTASQIRTNILRVKQDRELRRTAWNSLVRLSQQMAPKIRELLLQTNVHWLERGYLNANTPRLQALGVSEIVVRQVIASIEKETRSVAQSLLKEYNTFLDYEIAEWDWRFVATQMPHSFDHAFKNINAISCLKKTYKTLGINVERLPIQFDDNSAVHGIRHNAVRIPHDIIFSLGPISGPLEYYSLLYVLGEACYFAHLDGDLTYAFRRYAPKPLGEGLATLSSWLLWEYDWLEEFTNLAPNQIVEFSQQMKNYELLKLRYYAGFAAFEMEIYRALAEDPKIDLDMLYEQHMESFLLMPTTDRSMWAMAHWLIDRQGIPRFTNYVLGLAVAATLNDCLHEKGSYLFSKEFGKLFQSDLVRQGASSPWLERLQQLTAKTLTPFPMSWSRA